MLILPELTLPYKGLNADYTIKKPGNGVYAFVLSGDATINGQSLYKRDAIGIWNTDKISVIADSEAEILLMDVPMNV